MIINEETMNPEMTGMFVNQGMKDDLLCSAKWMKFLCIVICFGLVLLFLCGIVMIVFASSFGTNTAYEACKGFLYLIIAAIYIYPLIKGFQFANGTKTACLTDDASQLARGFSGLSSMLKFYGIITMICMIFYAIAIISGLILSLMK